MIVFIVYAAYVLLRNSIEDEQKRARLSAVFNIFAFILMILLLMVMPRMVDTSLHPGKSGNPAFSKYDLDSSLRSVFYPAVLGWAMLGYWIYTIQKKFELLKQDNHAQ
jgi:heme exporter protein C